MTLTRPFLTLKARLPLSDNEGIFILRFILLDGNGSISQKSKSSSELTILSISYPTIEVLSSNKKKAKFVQLDIRDIDYNLVACPGTLILACATVVCWIMKDRKTEEIKKVSSNFLKSRSTSYYLCFLSPPPVLSTHWPQYPSHDGIY